MDRLPHFQPYISPMQKGDPRVIRGWTMYDWANSVYSLTITTAIFPVFYLAVTHLGDVDLVKERYGLPAQSLYSYALSAGFLLVAIVIPLLSGIADHTGRKKTFLKAFCYLGSASCIGLFFFGLDTLWIGLFLVMMASVGFSGSLIFYDAFLPEIAEPKDHDRVSAQGYTMGYIGSVILLIFNLTMVMQPTWFGIAEGTDLPARISFIAVGLWWAGFAQFAFRVLPNNPYGRKASGDILLNGYRELRKVWRQLKSTRRLRAFLTAFFVFNMGVQTVMYLAVTYAKEEVKAVDGTGAIVPISDASLILSILIIQLVAIGGAFLFVWLSKRVGNVNTLIIGCITWILLCAFAYTIQWAWEFYALATGVGLVMGGTQALSRSTYSKFLPDTMDHASYFSFYDVSYYVGTVLGTFAYGMVYQLTDDLRNTVIIIGSFFVLALLLLFMVPSKETRVLYEGNGATS